MINARVMRPAVEKFNNARNRRIAKDEDFAKFSTILLNELTSFTGTQWSDWHQGGEFLLHASCANAGVSRETDPAYRWHGLRRGHLEFAIFQYTTGGEGELVFEGRRMPVRPGQAMLLHVPQDHCYQLPAVSGAFWEFFYISMWGPELMRIWRQATSLTGPVLRFGRNDPALKIAMRLCLGHLSPGVIRPCGSSAQVYAFAMAVLDRAGGLAASAELKRTRTPAVARAIGFCEENLHRRIGVPEMAAAAGFSQFHFSREFRKCEGMPPGRFLLNARLKKAAGLLTGTTLTIPEVADRCGFADANYFTRAFSRNTRMSPGAFRRSGLFD